MNEIVSTVEQKATQHENEIRDLNGSLIKLEKTVRTFEDEEEEAARAVSIALGNSTDMQTSTRSRRQLREDVEILKAQIAELERLLKKPVSTGDTSDPFQYALANFRVKKFDGTLFENRETSKPDLNQPQVKSVGDNILCDLYNQYLLIEEDLVNYKKNVLYHMNQSENAVDPEEDALRKKNVTLLDRVDSHESRIEQIRAELKALLVGTGEFRHTRRESGSKEHEGTVMHAKTLSIPSHSQPVEMEPLRRIETEDEKMHMQQDEALKMVGEITANLGEEVLENEDMKPQTVLQRQKTGTIDFETLEQLQSSLRLYIRTLVPETAIDDLQKQVQEIDDRLINSSYEQQERWDAFTSELQEIRSAQNQEWNERWEAVLTNQQELRTFAEETRKEVLENEMGISEAHRRIEELVKSMNEGANPGEEQLESVEVENEKNGSGKFNIKKDEIGGIVSNNNQIRKNSMDIERLRVKLNALDSQFSAFFDLQGSADFAFEVTEQDEGAKESSEKHEQPSQQEGFGFRHIMLKQHEKLIMLDNRVMQLEAHKEQLDVDKLYKGQKDNYDLLRKYIAEVNQYSADFYERLSRRMDMKADTDILSNFQNNVESKVLQQLRKKIDKIEHKRTQNALRKKIDVLENTIEVITHNPTLKFLRGINKEPVGPTVTKNSTKCISCNREYPAELAKCASQPSTLPNSNKYMFRELQQKGPKLGAGFSRILSKLNSQETLDFIRRKHSTPRHRGGESRNTRLNRPEFDTGRNSKGLQSRDSRVSEVSNATVKDSLKMPKLKMNMNL